MIADVGGRWQPPSRAVSLTVSAALALVWIVLRLVVFDTTPFPLTYVLPLLVCVWTMDRMALWGMAAVFAIVHPIKVLWLLPPGTLSTEELWANLAATLANILVGAIATDAIIALRGRLQRALAEVRAQADELRAQSEELAQQNEELAEQAEELSHQTEELSQQGEELASQNEEMQSQSEEISGLNLTLERRERLLGALLETTHSTSSEETALQQVAAATLELLTDVDGPVIIYEGMPEGLVMRALRTRTASPEVSAEATTDAGLAIVALRELRTAAMNDVALRPDLPVPTLADAPPVRAALCTPIRFADVTFGVLAVYHSGVRDWSADDFRLVEWSAAQCGRVLQTLRMQSELRVADQRKSEFLATLSHELRNPLAPIRFALTLVERDPSHPRAIDIINRQFQQLVRLVDDLLDVTRLSKNKIQLRRTRTDLAAIVRHATDAVRPDITTANQTLAVSLPETSVWLHADAERIAQVVTNLLSNATRYTPAGGHITVTVTTTESAALLTVADTGIGLAQGNLQRVFDMFAQVDGPGSGGLGIGLALVKGIVDLHGGDVSAHSDGPGRGSEFRVTFPLAVGAVAERDLQSTSLLPADSRRVLVVDDNIDAATMMAALLEVHGHEVWTAHDAERALALAHEIVPDVALLDIGLPGLDGYALARRLRDTPATQSIRLIAVTGWGQAEDRAQARDAGFDAHLTKPAEPNVILSIL